MKEKKNIADFDTQLGVVPPFQVLHFKVGSYPYPKKIDQAGNARQGQTLMLVTNLPE